MKHDTEVVDTDFHDRVKLCRRTNTAIYFEDYFFFTSSIIYAIFLRPKGPPNFSFPD